MVMQRVLLALLALATIVLQPVELVAKSKKTTDYSGTIGKLKVQMRLTESPIMETNNGETYQRGTRYTGHYFYAKEQRHIQVTGAYDAMAVGEVVELGIAGAVDHPVIELEEKTDDQTTGFFAGRFGRGGVYSGTWQSADGKRKLRFVLYPKPSR
ncbi:MAG TPA: hypothetical protein VKF81_13450 [Blastocatellia bacterium]|nr:hypothetical protein [Blastocatellia bacterium]